MYIYTSVYELLLQELLSGKTIPKSEIFMYIYNFLTKFSHFTCNLVHFFVWLIDSLILTECYFIPCGLVIAFIERLYLHFCVVSARSYHTNHPSKMNKRY